VEFREIRASLRRHWPVALLVLVLIPVVMGVYLLQRDVVRPPARYTTSADVLIPARTEDNEAPEDVPPVLLQGQTELALDSDTTDAALRAAGIEDDEADDVRFSAKLNDTRSIMTLSVEAPESELAASLVDEYIIAYQNGRRQSVLDAAAELEDIQINVISRLTDRLEELEDELVERDVAFPPVVPDGEAVATPANASIETNLLLYARNAVLNEIQRRNVGYSLSATQATAPGTFTTVVQRRSTARITPPPPSPLVPLLEILGIGLVLAVLIPVILDKADSTITEPKAAPGALRAGLLATIPHLPRRLHQALAPPGSTWELAFRSLAATSISTDRLPRAIMVTSPAEATQDAVAANFAAALAGLGATVALIGTVPRQKWFLHDVVDPESDESAANGSTPTPPRPAAATATSVTVATFPELLDDAQNGRLNGDLRSRLGQREIDNLFIVPPGEEHTELSLDGLPPLLEALASSGIDITVIAGPALLEDPNATIIAWSTRHVLWAVEIGQVNKNDAHLAADRLELAGVEPFGIALVNRSALRT
jgi:capsular polysaccharide biosynthesis protein